MDGKVANEEEVEVGVFSVVWFGAAELWLVLQSYFARYGF